MKIISDLHFHSRFSRAVSPQMTIPTISLWAQKKGIDLVTTSDFTHPLWFRELQTNLEEEEEGIYKLKESNNDIKFILTTEISCIYSKSGKGRRSSFGVGAFLVGIKDKDKFKTVSKIGTGLTDEQWKELNRRTRKISTGEKPSSYVLHKNLNPDAWVKPSLVVEILADEITKSPIHTAGLALRFPRLVRFRDDKKAKNSNNLQELKKLFKMQKV